LAPGTPLDVRLRAAKCVHHYRLVLSPGQCAVSDDLLAQKPAVHQPPDAPIEHGTLKLNGVEPGQFEQLRMRHVAGIGHKVQQLVVPVSQRHAAFQIPHEQLLRKC